MDEKSYIRLIVRAGEALQALKDEELRNAPHPRVAIEALNEAFRFAVRTRPPGDTSGLVEFQRLMARLRRPAAEGG